MGDRYELRYLPLFYDDLADLADYITYRLKNPEAAKRLVDEVERSILERRECPKAFEPYQSHRKRPYPYYRIYVGNYVVYYVVIGNVMEVRRILYGKREMETLLD